MSNSLTLNYTQISRYLAGDSEIVSAKLHGNRLRIDRKIGKKHALQTNDAKYHQSKYNLLGMVR